MAQADPIEFGAATGMTAGERLERALTNVRRIVSLSQLQSTHLRNVG